MRSESDQEGFGFVFIRAEEMEKAGITMLMKCDTWKELIGWESWKGL